MIWSPGCPWCGQPGLVLCDEQALCLNDGCTVVMWNPSLSPEELRKGQVETVDLDLFEEG